MSALTVIVLDPGIDGTGVCVIRMEDSPKMLHPITRFNVLNWAGRAERIVETALWKGLKPSDPLPNRLHELGRQLEECIGRWPADFMRVVIERPSVSGAYGRNEGKIGRGLTFRMDLMHSAIGALTYAASRRAVHVRYCVPLRGSKDTKTAAAQDILNRARPMEKIVRNRDVLDAVALAVNINVEM